MNLYFYVLLLIFQAIWNVLSISFIYLGVNLDRPLHEVPDGTGSAESLPGNQTLFGDEIQKPKGERTAGKGCCYPVSEGITVQHSRRLKELT